MTDKRWHHLTQQINALDAKQTLLHRTCVIAAESLQAEHASIAMVVNRSYSSVAATDQVATFLDEQQFVIGHGPTFEAAEAESPVLASDLHQKGYAERWPAFIESAQRHNVFAIYAFPLRVGSAYIGTLTVYRKKPGELSAQQLSDGLFFATLATTEIVRERAEAISGSNAQSAEFLLFEQSALQIAAGMVAELLNCSVIDALVRIRAHAFKNDMPVSVVASQIVNRELTLEG